MVPRRLLCWRDSPQRLSRIDARYGLDRFTACKAAFLAAGFLADTDAYILWGYGHTGRQLHRALRHHGKRLAAVIDVHPGRLGNSIDGAPVLPYEQLSSRRSHRLVVSVAGARPRAAIRAALAQMGWQEGSDFICAA